MKYTDETLMAYADGELDEVTRAAIERAMQSDPAIAARVAQHRALRERIYAACAPMLDEAVPQRLRQAAAPAGAKVIALDSARGAKDVKPRARRWSWPEWGAMAATLLVGVMAGRQSFDGGDYSSVGGALVAQGALERALSTQLASQPGTDTRIGVSFVANNGAYCRSFMRGSTAGLACREGKRWTLPMVAKAQPSEQAGEYRQAGAEMPAAVLEAIDARIAGKPLDAAEEQAARAQDWRPGA